MPGAVQSQGTGTVPQNPFWKSLVEILIYLALSLGAAGVLFCVLYVILLNALNWLKLRKLTQTPQVEKFKGLRMKKKRRKRRNKGEVGAALVYGHSHLNNLKPIDKNDPGKKWRPDLKNEAWLHQNPTELEAFDTNEEQRHNREFERQRLEFSKTSGARAEREEERRIAAREESARKRRYDSAAQLDGRLARTLARQAPHQAAESERAVALRPETGSPRRLGAPGQRVTQVARSAPGSARKKRRRKGKVQPIGTEFGDV